MLHMYDMGMEKRTPITIKLPPELLKRLDAVIAASPVKPTRTAFIEAAVLKLVEEYEPKGKRK